MAIQRVQKQEEMSGFGNKRQLKQQKNSGESAIRGGKISIRFPKQENISKCNKRKETEAAYATKMQPSRNTEVARARKRERKRQSEAGEAAKR